MEVFPLGIDISKVFSQSADKLAEALKPEGGRLYYNATEAAEAFTGRLGWRQNAA